MNRIVTNVPEPFAGPVPVPPREAKLHGPGREGDRRPTAARH